MKNETGIDESGLSAAQVRTIIAFIGAVPLLAAFTLFGEHPVGHQELLRDLTKDFGVVIGGLLVVDLVWSLVGGDPIARHIRVLTGELINTEGSLTRFSALTSSAEKAGLINLGADSTALQYPPGEISELIRQAKTEICISGLVLLLFHENPDLLTDLMKAASRGARVRVLLCAEDNRFLAGIAEENVLKAMQGVIANTTDMMSKQVASSSGGVDAGPGKRIEARKLINKMLMIAILRFDDKLLVTPYLVSAMTPASPRFTVGDSATPLFRAWMREFDFLFDKASDFLPKTH